MSEKEKMLAEMTADFQKHVSVKKIKPKKKTSACRAGQTQTGVQNQNGKMMSTGIHNINIERYAYHLFIFLIGIGLLGSLIFGINNFPKNTNIIHDDVAKIDFEKYDVDVKGKAYELTIQKEGSTNKDFSQFFTPRWIDKYMVDNAEIKINKDGDFTSYIYLKNDLTFI